MENSISRKTIIGLTPENTSYSIGPSEGPSYKVNNRLPSIRIYDNNRKIQNFAPSCPVQQEDGTIKSQPEFKYSGTDYTCVLVYKEGQRQIGIAQVSTKTLITVHDQEKGIYGAAETGGSTANVTLYSIADKSPVVTLSFGNKCQNPYKIQQKDCNVLSEMFHQSTPTETSPVQPTFPPETPQVKPSSTAYSSTPQTSAQEDPPTPVPQEQQPGIYISPLCGVGGGLLLLGAFVIYKLKKYSS